MAGIWDRITGRNKGHSHDDGAEQDRQVPAGQERVHGGDEVVDGAPRTDATGPGTAPPDVADEDEVNVGGAPRTHAHEPGHAPAMKADTGEALVDGAPRRVEDAPYEGTVDGAPRFGDEGQAGEDFRHHPQA